MMKRYLLKNIARRLAGSTAIVLLVFGSLPASAQISSTRHNLSSPAGPNSTATFTPTAPAVGELCVFCHTPHGADTTAVVPLWNRVIAATAYQTYNTLGTSSMDGATTAVGSVSAACLSCHDGVAAMNVMINQPGSGGYNPTGAAWSGVWSGGGQTGGLLGTATSITRIGTDLRNDHPIGNQYAGGPTAATLPGVGTPYGPSLFRDPDFKTANSATLNGQPVWWVDSGVQGNGRQKTDMQLYTRASAYIGGTTSPLPSTTPQPYVECASCHDPHTAVNPTFLRVSNAGSGLCLTCHTK